MNPLMFTKRVGRRHAVLGVLYLFWIMFGICGKSEFIVNNFSYDVVLGCLGVLLSLSAAFDFQHKNIKNFASGTLDEHATVTYDEMIEHSFYQILNLIQAIFLHSFGWQPDIPIRIILLVLVTSPWLIRHKFPINKFSANYNKIDPRSNFLIRFLYRTKKYQYLFYKHFLLHGLNISLTITGEYITNNSDFRLYWLLLNISYVMEFFLQTLVKKKYMSQRNLYFMQFLLMSASTYAAIKVLQKVDIFVSICSFLLNFIHRKHDMINTIVLLLIAFIFKYFYHFPLYTIF